MKGPSPSSSLLNSVIFGDFPFKKTEITKWQSQISYLVDSQKKKISYLVDNCFCSLKHKAHNELNYRSCLNIESKVPSNISFPFLHT